MIEIKNLSLGFVKSNGIHSTRVNLEAVKPVLENLSLTIEPGHVYGLIGRNGAGKTSLMNCITGILTFKRKHQPIYLDGVKLNVNNPNDHAKLFYVTDTISSIHILADAFANTLACFYPNFSVESYKEYMEMFSMDRNVFLDELSLGEKKIVFLSYAFASGAPYIIMDEPTNGLDITSRKVFRKLIASYMTPDRAIVISTHHINEISSLLDHILILDKRHLVFDHSVMETGSVLSFIESDDEDLRQQALYSMTSAYGNRMILPNTSDTDSEIDYELLFEAVLENGKAINELFENK
ncbi:MAG: ABC transporter ATP-binding protein [Bacteroidaceae bacterium]|nr:ABC transporter ATP-binding protein [Bacteroidaceae bacterium]